MKRLMPLLLLIATAATVAAANPTITSITPNCITAGGPQFTLTVTGTNYETTSLVRWNGTNLATTFVSSTQLTATVPAANIATAGTVPVTVKNSTGSASNSVTFTIVALPTISSLNQTCATAGGPGFTLTVNGTNFAGISTVNWNGTPLTTTFVSSTRLTATVPFGLIANVGTASITVVSCGTTSNAQTFTIAATPVITSVLTGCGAVGVPFSYTLTATNNPTSFTVSSLPPGLTFNPITGVISGTPTTTGTTSVTVTATNGAGPCNTATATLLITIGATSGNPPVITSPLTATGLEGDPFLYTITATNTNNPTYTVTGTLPQGVSQGSGANRNVISGTPASGTAGQYSVKISVSNGAGGCNTASAILVITICQDVPGITSPLTANAIIGTPFTYQITADNGPISFDATDLPGGLTVDTTTGLISGTPTAAGTFPVTISASSNGTGPCGISTASDTLLLTVSLPGGVTIPLFPGQANVFYWGPTPPDDNATITFPNSSADNYYVLYWNAGGSNTNPHIADSSNGGLQRNPDATGMRQNYYTPPGRPDPTKNVWRGNAVPPNDNTLGQFGDPRASWYITSPWPTADYVTGSYWGGPHPSLVPLSWPDSGHPFSYTGVQPTGPGQYPTDIMASPTPSPDPTKGISLLSPANSGYLASITELGNVWDPAQLTYTVVNPGGALPDIPTSAIRDPRGGGGHTLAIGRPEFSMFDQNGMRAWQLLDVFTPKTSGNAYTATNTAGLVNINTASRDVLRSLAVGILQNRDSAILPLALRNNLYPPTSTASATSPSTSVQQADRFADAVINSRPLLSTAALSAIRDSQGNPFFGNPNEYQNSTQTPPTEWNDPGREELFAKIYNLATTRSRNFRVFVTGQSLDKKGNVLSTVTKVYHVFLNPNRCQQTAGCVSGGTNYSYGAIMSQQVQIKYEGSM